MIFSNKTYDFLKKLATIVLPAIGVCYTAVATAFGWPSTEVVVGVISAIAGLIGTLLKVSSDNYQGDASLQILNVAELEEDESPIGGLTWNPNLSFEDLVSKDVIVVKLNKPPASQG